MLKAPFLLSLEKRLRDIARNAFDEGKLSSDDAYLWAVQQALEVAGSITAQSTLEHIQESEKGSTEHIFWKNVLEKQGKEASEAGKIPPLDEIKKLTQDGPIFFDGYEGNCSTKKSLER